jgi:hypothetical protein
MRFHGASERVWRDAGQSFSKNSQAEHEINIPPGTPRSRSFIRFTMRVGLPHFGQSVLLDVSITFLRSAVLATLAIYVSVSTNQSGVAALPLTDVGGRSVTHAATRIRFEAKLCSTLFRF